MSRIGHVSLAFLLLWAVGCAKGLNYKVLEGNLGSGNCGAATVYVQENEEDYGSNRRLLYLLDAAQVNLYCANYRESNRYFHLADELAEELWTKSLTKEAASFLINDLTIPYGGEDFEKALINLHSAINYSALGQFDEALVECRRLDANLNVYNDKYDEKNVYKEDAFGRYLSGLIYESAGELDNAYIDYYKAYKVFSSYEADYGTPMPGALVDDLLRIAGATDRMSEVREELGIAPREGLPAQAETGKLGRIVFIHFNGKAPVKLEDRVVIPLPGGPSTLAFPRFMVRPPACRKSELVASTSSGGLKARAELVEDINGIAVKNLSDRKARVIAKAIARAAIKRAAVEAASSQIEDERVRRLTRFGLNIMSAALERADTRSWRTLPGEIYMARLYVPEGRYGLSAGLCDGRVRQLDSVDIKAGETRFVLLTTRF
jgi:hypothetical protein